MPNGTAALALLLPASESDPTGAVTKVMPIAVTTPVCAKANPAKMARLGALVADAAVSAIGAGLADWATGGQLTDVTRIKGSEALARVSLLRLDAEIPDFDKVARAAGKSTLLQRYGATLRERYGTISEPALDELIDWVLVITSKVVADELTYRRQHPEHKDAERQISPPG